MGLGVMVFFLQGEADREAVRVTMECCLQEASWNPYYQLLLIHLCQSSRSHQVTAQFCLWDHWRMLRDADSAKNGSSSEALPEKLRRASHLAQLGGSLIATLALPPTALKAADFTAAMGPHELLHWRLFFQHVLNQPCSAKAGGTGSKQAAAAGDALWQAFSRMASQPKLQANCAALRLWLRNHFRPWLKMRAAKEADSRRREVTCWSTGLNATSRYLSVLLQEAKACPYKGLKRLSRLGWRQHELAAYNTKMFDTGAAEANEVFVDVNPGAGFYPVIEHP
ncbi:hypothetical protein WJX84_010830 [Apatococcus fuscideae]|uniref:MI domain-containing protein n=1 Tax=Apatococcus fuscideae TaxID=2026836 RepID=A0AAW1T0X8_9CHLO